MHTIAAQQHRSRFPATIDGVVAAAAWLHGVVETEALPGKLAFGLEVCLEELFTNVMKHGGPGPATLSDEELPLTVDLALELAGPDVALLVEDNGQPFDVSQAPAKPIRRPLEEVMPGGLGMKLIRSFSSELLYEPLPGGNRVIVKFLRDGAAETTSGS
jgi:anti-sigma regulatory factor (Ser/Thr protein kinase)